MSLAPLFRSAEGREIASSSQSTVGPRLLRVIVEGLQAVAGDDRDDSLVGPEAPRGGELPSTAIVVPPAGSVSRPSVAASRSMPAKISGSLAKPPVPPTFEDGVDDEISTPGAPMARE